MTKLIRPMSPAELAEHIRQLAAAFNISIAFDKSIRTEDSIALALGNKDVIAAAQAVVRPVVDEVTYCVALHEMGHIAAPFGMLAPSRLERERVAWEWARHYALIWTTAMDQVEKIGMDSHILKQQTEDRARAAAAVRDKTRSKELRGFVKKLKL